MPDYSKGKIYKLYNEDEPDKCYIGSTVKELSYRYKNHKESFNTCISRTLFEDNKTPIIELLEEYPCNNRKELEIRERYWAEQYPNRINRCIPTRTKREWYDDNIEARKEYKRQYDIKNRDAKLEYMKQYRLRKKLSTENSEQNILSPE